ncbi:MAG: hypothetical protein KAH25_03260 [Bacteroidales bacterium]|nr:hypothetical protein [Bacteroidales bacterium]
MKNLLLLSLLIGLTISCKTEAKKETTEKAVSYQQVLKKMEKSSFKSAKTLEAINSGSYTYVKLADEGKEFWAAVSVRQIEIGHVYFYKDALEMKNFHSKGLDRVFESILFINDFHAEIPNIQEAKHTSADHKTTAKSEISPLDAPKDGYSLENVFMKKDELKDQIIIVKGEVVKISRNIMSTNWIHIQDGTNYEGINDLTVTSSQAINYSVGDVVTFKGKLILDKDFGSGYKYAFLLEDAVKQ